MADNAFLQFQSGNGLWVAYQEGNGFWGLPAENCSLGSLTEGNSFLSLEGGEFLRVLPRGKRFSGTFCETIVFVACWHDYGCFGGKNVFCGSPGGKCLGEYFKQRILKVLTW